MHPLTSHLEFKNGFENVIYYTIYFIVINTIYRQKIKTPLTIFNEGSGYRVIIRIDLISIC